MSKKINFDEMQKRVKENIGDDYILVKYQEGKYEKSEIKHSCGHTYWIQNQIISSSKKTKGRCPKCFYVKGGYSHEQVQNIVNEKLGNTYHVLEYTGKRDPIKLLHDDCGEEILLYLGNIQKGQQCNHCKKRYDNISKSNRYTTEDFKKIVSEKTDNRIELKSEYTNSLTPVKMFCNECKKEFSLIPTNFIRGTRCPYCKATSGEQIIIQFLEKYNIEYEFQKLVKIGNFYYKFDFFLNNKNIVIEFDGAQHSKPAFPHKDISAEENLVLTQKRDANKNKYCSDNNIRMIRIPYYKINKIETILIENLQISSTTIENTEKSGSE